MLGKQFKIRQHWANYDENTSVFGTRMNKYNEPRSQYLKEISDMQFFTLQLYIPIITVNKWYFFYNLQLNSSTQQKNNKRCK